MSTYFTNAANLTNMRADKYVCPGCEKRTGEKTTRELISGLLIHLVEPGSWLSSAAPMFLVPYVALDRTSMPDLPFIICQQTRDAVRSRL